MIGGGADEESHRRTTGAAIPLGVLLAAGVLVVAIGAQACATGRRAAPADGPVYGVYRVRLEPLQEKPRRFRMLLYAELPDRLHAEALPPLGGPQLILDAGGGRLAVTSPSEGIAWVGEADPAVLERILGLRIGIGQLVAFLVAGEDPGLEWKLERRPGQRRGLPNSCLIDSPQVRLAMRLKRRRRIEGPHEALGTGRPPPGVEVRPLEELVDNSAVSLRVADREGP